MIKESFHIKNYNPFTKQNKLPFIISLLIHALFLGIIFFLINSYNESQFLKKKNEATTKMSDKRAILEGVLNRMLQIPHALSLYASIKGTIDGDFFMTLSENLATNLPAFKNISLAPNNIIAHIYPLEGNEKAIGLDFKQYPKQNRDVMRAITSRKTIISNPVALVQGGEGIIIRSPVYISSFEDDNYWGLISMVIDYDSLKEKLSELIYDDNYSFAIRKRSVVTNEWAYIIGDSLIFNQNPICQNINILEDVCCEIAVVPKLGWNNAIQYPVLVYGLSIVAMLLATLALYVLAINHRILKGLYEEKVSLVNDLEKSNNTQNLIGRIIAHDLRAPFNVLVATVSLLDNSDENYRKLLINDLKLHAEGLNFLLDNMLNWSKTQLKDIEFNPEKHKLNVIVNETIYLLAPIATNKQIEIISEIPSDYDIVCDRDLLTTIIRNLLSNAIKFTDNNGFIKFWVESNAKFSSIYIKDTGIGIPMGKQNSLFEMSTNKTSFGTNGEKGTGFGLALCKELISIHNGEITLVESSSNGTTFRLKIPK